MRPGPSWQRSGKSLSIQQLLHDRELALKEDISLLQRTLPPLEKEASGREFLGVPTMPKF